MRVALPDFTNLSRRERLFAVGSFLVVCMVLLDRVVLGPWLGHARNIRREIQHLEKAIRNDRELIRRKPQIVAQATAYQEYLRLDQSAEPDMASLLREIETLGSRSGISLGEVKPLEGTANESYQEYAIEVQYKGSLQEWVHFVYLLQTSRSRFEVERATIARTEEGSDQVAGSLRLVSKVNRGSQAAFEPST